MMPSLPNTLKRNGWREWHVWASALLVVIGVAVTLGAWRDIFHIAWTDEEQSHVLLVPIIFAWLVWVRRGRLRQCRPVGTWVGPIVIALGWLISWYGFNNAVQSFWHGGSLMIVLGCAICVLGTDVFWRLLPAIIVLGFLVPVPGLARQQIALPMQTATAEVTHQMFAVLGYHVPRSGNMLTINDTPVGIAEACNGLRMVFALVLVSYAFAFGTPLRWYVRAAVIGLSPVSAILCNVLRLLPTVWLYGYAPQSWADRFHDIAGWAMLVVAFLLLMGVVRVLRWALIPVTPYTLAYD
jgi:exosortase